MAHFAKLDANNVVVDVRVGIAELGDDEDAHSRVWGGTWKRTSYNTREGKHTGGGTPHRKNYAGIGFVFDEVRDAFISPRPYPSWLLNEQKGRWEAPTPFPDGGRSYIWDENTISWKEIP
jgi:hypothetical protein